MNKRLFSLFLLVLVSATAWAQTTLYHLERTASLKDAFASIYTYGISGTPQGAIEVRMYEKSLYTTGGRTDTPGFLYGATAATSATAITQNIDWTVTAPTGECVDAFGGVCQPTSTTFKPRFLRTWKRIAPDDSYDLVADDPTIDVVIEIVFSGLANPNDLTSITLPGIGPLVPDNLVQNAVRGVDFEVKTVSDLTNFTIGTDTYTLSEMGTTVSGMKLAVPTSATPFYKVMKGTTAAFALAKDEAQLTASLGNYSTNSSTTVTSIIANAVKINDIQYSVFKISKTQNQNVLLATAADGPYIIAPDIVIQKFQQNSVNEKLLNRSNHTSDIMIAAHRGFWQEAGTAENTISAFTKAMTLGSDMLEVDIHETADGKFILFHDTYADRLLQFPGVTDMSVYKSVEITKYKYASSIVDAGSGLNLPALNTAFLKDRFRTTTSERLLVFEDLMDYVNTNHKLISLDHAIDYAKPLSKMLMEQDIEDYFFFKGNGRTTPDDLKTEFGVLMQQIAYTPVFQEWLFADPSSQLAPQGFDALAYWSKFMDYRISLNWTIPGCEVNFKKEIRATPDEIYGAIPYKGWGGGKDPGVTYAQHTAAKTFVDDHKDEIWIGLSPWFPLFGDDPWSPEEPTASKNFAPIYDWRADLSFCIDYCHLNYLITDQPKYTVNYWNARSGD